MKDYRNKIYDILKKKGAMNSMEVCRVLNGFPKDSFEKCYPNEFSYETKQKRCNHEERGCEVWSLTVYNQLRSLKENGRIKSIKMKWFDGRKGDSAVKTDIFRFWYVEPKQLGRMLIRSCKTYFDL